jgi:uncharacterized protein (TIGR02996 family)
MTPREAMLAALHACPADDTAWLALADALEEEGLDGPAELGRLHRQMLRLREGPKRREVEQRVIGLLASGARPIVPEITNSIGMRLALIPPGAFRMGSPGGEPRRMDDELLHRVRITRPFYLGVFQVTQDDFAAVTRRRPSHFRASRVKSDANHGRFPVDSVSWDAAHEFCRRLTDRKDEKAAGRGYRLPTEAEWEYACRAGISSRCPFHLGTTLQAGQANFDCRHPYPLVDGAPLAEMEAEYLNRPCEVGRYAPNAWGLYDMHGNVDEWCQDHYDDDYYESSPSADPPGPEAGSSRIVRGGSWRGQGEDNRAAVRIGYGTGATFWHVGFRVACDVGG